MTMIPTLKMFESGAFDILQPVQYFAASNYYILHRASEIQVALDVIKFILGYFMKTIQ
jgi:hypothetical protein